MSPSPKTRLSFTGLHSELETNIWFIQWFPHFYCLVGRLIGGSQRWSWICWVSWLTFHPSKGAWKLFGNQPCNCFATIEKRRVLFFFVASYVSFHLGGFFWKCMPMFHENHDGRSAVPWLQCTNWRVHPTTKVCLIWSHSYRAPVEICWTKCAEALQMNANDRCFYFVCFICSDMHI